MSRLTASEYKAEVKRLKARVNKLVREHKAIMSRCLIVDTPDGNYQLQEGDPESSSHADLPHAVGRRMYLLNEQINKPKQGVQVGLDVAANTIAELKQQRDAEHAELDQAAINGVTGIDISTLPEHVVERLNVLAKSAAYYRRATELQAGLPAGSIVLDGSHRPIGVTLPQAMEGKTIHVFTRGIETPVVKDHCDEPPTCHHTESMNGMHVSIAYSGKHTERQQSIISLGFRLITTLLRKNQDYGNSAARSPLFAPELSPDAAVRVRMSDKAERIISLSSPEKMDGPAVQNESLQDTYLDLAGYCILQTINLNAPKQS